MKRTHRSLSKLSASIAFILLTTLTVNGQKKDVYYGPLKINFWGFVCNNATKDDPFGMDGVGDEVSIYMNSFTSVFNSLMSGRRSGIGPVFGEDFLPMDERIKAGSATINGGLKAGDSYVREAVYGNDEPNTRSKYAILSGWGDENTLIAILPVVFEKDKDNPVGKPIQDFDVALNRAFNDMSVRQKIFALSYQCDQYNGSNPYAFIQFGSLLGIDNYFTGLFNGYQNKLMSHPVGILPDGQFRSKVLVFTPKMLMILAQKDFGYGKGIIPVNYDDAAMGNIHSNGSYTILLQVIADIKKRETQAPPTPLQQPAPLIIKKQPVLLNTLALPVVAMNNEFLSGVWSGTIGTSTSNNDDPYSFKFANNAFWVLNQQGSATASGGYQITNGNFTATYFDTNGWKYEVTSTGYNINTGELSGNWTCTGANYYKTGKWVSKKISN